jgi:dCMP deaminase
MSKRSSWDQYFMEKAEHAATRATCERLSVGAVLVRGKRDIVTGYNGSGEGEPHCIDPGVGCLMYKGSCKRTIHAEMNVVDYCAKKGIPMEGASIYVTHYPCPICMQHIAHVGIVEVVYKNFYKHQFINTFGKKLLIRQFEGDPEQ